MGMIDAMSVERFVPDELKKPKILQELVDSGLSYEAGGAKLERYHKYLIAKGEIGEPPMRDQIKDISHWVKQRILEIEEDVGPHRSEVAIIRENQELWHITDREELALEMRGLLYASTFFTVAQGVRYELRYSNDVTQFEYISTSDKTIFTEEDRQQFRDVLNRYKQEGSPALPKRNYAIEQLRESIAMEVFLGKDAVTFPHP